MASNTVAVRLPEEVLEELQRRASVQNKKISDVVRELIGVVSENGK
jgi:predicted DNA-binding protein